MKRIALYRNGSIVFAIIGLIDSVYLTWIKVANKEAICRGIGDCESVNTSIYAEIAGIPIALIGVFAYLGILFLIYLERQGGFWGEYAIYFQFGVTLAGVVYSAYLTYIEIAVLQAICPFCVVSAVALLILLFLTIIRLFQSEFAVTG